MICVRDIFTTRRRVLRNVDNYGPGEIPNEQDWVEFKKFIRSSHPGQPDSKVSDDLASSVRKCIEFMEDSEGVYIAPDYLKRRDLWLRPVRAYE